MNEKLISAIKAFTLQARTDLECEAHEQLEGLYGWLPDGSFNAAVRYPALVVLDEAHETRSRLEQYAHDEAEAGFEAVKARHKLVRETAFTWLNRFVALKMLESRRILKTLLAPPERANAYLLWLADEHDLEARRMHEAGDVPINALGEGPRQTAFRRFLLWQCGELAKQVSVLFDPATLASRLFPRPNSLQMLISGINEDTLAEAWNIGNEEAVGWIYEGFIENDITAVFEKFSKGKKVLPEEIGAATQRFTPRWIVQFLVQNSLGRLWMEMHPDSSLKDKLAYIVPPVGDPASRPLKSVREILFLDPACGSMHFGLVAFDLFLEMYREEIARAGQPGWPTKSSVVTEAEIPSAIVSHNLHGIDLEQRAVQIAALALLIKAKGLQHNAVVTDRNLACCNVETITGGRLDDIIRGAKFAHPVYERILQAMTDRLKDSNNLGILLRPECDLERQIDYERDKLDRSAGMFPGMGESDLYTLDTPEKREKFFTGLASEIKCQLDDFVRQSRTTGKDESHFVDEASKGLNFLRLAQQRYDVVATNPPYMSRRNMSDIMSRFLDDEYETAKGDLYAAFIVRCVELTDPLGLIAMVTQQSFMFISSYENLREELRDSIAIKVLTHLGPKAFPNITGEKVNTTAFVFEKQVVVNRREESMGVYFRLVKECDSEAKRISFESALAAIWAGQSNHQVFTYKQSDFDALPGKPWVYWITPSLRNVFNRFPSLQIAGDWRRGLSTADNKRFLRLWWEVGLERIGMTCKSEDECVVRAERWFPLAKGGSFQRWCGNQFYCINYGNNGRELKAWLDPLYNNSGWSRMIKSPEHYFREAITYSSVTSSSFSARLTPAGSVFDQASNAIFLRDCKYSILTLLAILNSKFAAWTLSLSPTINIVKDDIYRIPVPEEQSANLLSLTERVLLLAKRAIFAQETSTTYFRPFMTLEESKHVKDEQYNVEIEIDREVSRLYKLSDEDLLIIDRELSENHYGTNNQVVDSDSIEEDREVQPSELSQLENSQHWISYAIGSVLGRFEVGKPSGLGCGDFPEDMVAKIRKLVVENGILPCEKGHPYDLVARVLKCLNLMLGVDDAREAIRTATGEAGDPNDALREWLDRFSGPPAQSFWRYHFQQYRKRPVYWPLQSPKKNYTIWLFHEKLESDTLFYIRTEIVETRLRLAEREIADLRVRAATDRKAAKELDYIRDLSDDLREFVKKLKAITERGYTPQIDDGVLLNAAPLHEILPSWPDSASAWKELEAGKYDWAHQAMAFWSERVKEACRTNKSFAIAHGLVVSEVEKHPPGIPKRRVRKKGEK